MLTLTLAVNFDTYDLDRQTDKLDLDWVKRAVFGGLPEPNKACLVGVW